MDITKIIVGATVALLMIGGVLIPTVTSSSYATLDNGEPVGLTYDYTTGEPSGIMTIERESSSVSFSIGNDVVVVDKKPIIVFASENVGIFMDDAARIILINSSGVYSFSSANSISWENGKVRVDNSYSYDIGAYAYIPAIKGHYGFYDQGDLYITDTPIVGIGVFGDYIGQDYYADWGASYYNGTTDYGTGSWNWAGTSTVTIDNGKLMSITWPSPVGGTTEVTPITYKDRAELVNLGTPTSQATLYAGGEGTSTYADFVFYDTGKCMIYNYHYVQGDFEDSYVVYNNRQYTIAAIGDGENPVTTGTNFNAENWSELELINEGAFYGVTITEGMVPIPDVVGGSAFYNATVPIGYTIYPVWVGDYAFYGMTNPSVEGVSYLNGTQVSMDYLNYVGASAFEGCQIDTYAEGMSGIYYIGDSAFKNSTADLNDIMWGLDAVAIRYIGASAFEGCQNLVSDNTLYLGPYVEEVGDRAFYGVENVTNAILNTPATFGNDVFGESSIETVNVYGGTVPTQEQIGEGINLIVASGVIDSIGYIAPTYILIEKDGVQYKLLNLLPLILVAGAVVAVAGVIITRK